MKMNGVYVIIMSNKTEKKDVLFSELDRFRSAFASLLLFSFVINIISIVPTIYMLQLFERVMQSRNEATLIFLTLIAVGLIIVWTILESIRFKVLQRVGVAVDQRVGQVVFDALNRQTDKLSAIARNTILQDLNILREFISGSMVVQLLDFVFAPLFVMIAFLFHPLLGLTLFLVVVVIAGLTLLQQRLIRDDVKRGQQAGAQASDFGRSVMAAAEPVRVMGMLPRLTQRWYARQTEMLSWQGAALDRARLVSDGLRFMRHAYPIIMLGVGVLLFLEQLVGAGAVFAASLLSSRAVGPVDAVTSNSKMLWSVRLSADRLNIMLTEAANRPSRVPLPRPDGELVVARATLTPPHRENIILNDISFTVATSRILGVVGASGSGKSSLARALVGAWRPRRGLVSIAGHDLSHWDQDQLGRHIGYVPQDVQLLPGTVAENIARFEDGDETCHEKLLMAVKIAGVQDIIQMLPDGLNTRLGPDGHTLSGGQRQRLALARAVFGDPSLVVLDEPNSNLDAIGEERLARTMSELKSRGTIVVIITHRLNIISHCDDVLVMNAGSVHAFGRREQILARLPSYRPVRQLAHNNGVPA
jgi:PrtD family type I secretion system ABC transporter